MTLLPCFLRIFPGEPFIERLRSNGVRSWAVYRHDCGRGVILNVGVWFGLHFLFRKVAEVRLGLHSLDVPQVASLDPIALVLFVTTVIALFRSRLGVVSTLLGAAG